MIDKVKDATDSEGMIKLIDKSGLSVTIRADVAKSLLRSNPNFYKIAD